MPSLGFPVVFETDYSFRSNLGTDPACYEQFVSAQDQPGSIPRAHGHVANAPTSNVGAKVFPCGLK